MSKKSHVTFTLIPGKDSNPETATEKININPALVSAVRQVGNTDTSEIQMDFGQIYVVQGTFDEVTQALWGDDTLRKVK